MAVEISHPRGSILDMEDILKLNYFAADDVRSRENTFCVCAEFPII